MDSIGFILVILWASMLVEAQPTSTVNVTSTPIPASSDDGMWYDVFTGSFLPWGYIGIGIGVAFALSVGIVCCLCCIKKKKTNPNFSHRPQQQQQQTHQRLQDATPLTRSGSISAAMNPIKQAFPNNNNNDSDVEVRTISRSQTPMTNTSVRRARPPPPASQPKSVSFRSVTPTTPHSETRKALLPATPPSGRKSAPNTPKGGPPVMARPLQGPATITNSARRKCFEIYGFGRNVEGQLGVLEGGDIFTPILIRIDESLTTGNKEVVRDVAVACGSYHTLIMVNGRLFVTGEGTYGQLGLNDASSVNTLICNDFFNAEDDNRVLKIAAGEQHSIVVSTQGVYSFGCGSEGQLGLGDFSDSIYPERIPAFTGPGSEVEIVASGSHHNVVVIRRARGANTPPVQEVYTFGWNQNGQLMVGHMTSLATPTLIPFFEHVHVIAVSCGVTHTVVLGGLGAQRNVYVCGAGNYGQLGLMGAIECISVPQPITFFFSPQGHWDSCLVPYGRCGGRWGVHVWRRFDGEVRPRRKQRREG
eukprot:PhF_6_TR6108/c0_g1_i1/m.9003